MTIPVTDTGLTSASALHPASMHPRLYPVRNRSGRWGYIDETGALIIDYRFDDAGRYSEGLADVSDGDTQGYVDSLGEWQFFHKFIVAGGFSCGLAMYKDPDHRCGYIDRSGNVAIEPKFDGAATFSSGVAVVRVGERFGLIRPDGSQIVRCKMDFCHSFVQNEKVTSFKVKGKWGLISSEGDVIVSPRWEFCHRFAEGIVPVRRDEVWGLANDTGDILLEGKFSETNFTFQEGRIGVTDDRQWWFIDRFGNHIGDSTFTYVEEYEDGMAAVYVGGTYDPLGAELVCGGMWGYVNLAGKIVIAPRYDDCRPFHGPLARVEYTDPSSCQFVFAYINRTGAIVWKP